MNKRDALLWFLAGALGCIAVFAGIAYYQAGTIERSIEAPTAIAFSDGEGHIITCRRIYSQQRAYACESEDGEPIQ